MGNRSVKDINSKQNIQTMELNKTVLKSLEMLGYSMEMIQYRRDMNKRLDEIHNSKPFSVINITTGGKADGSALYFESDIDRLYVVKGTACVLPVVSSDVSTVLLINRNGCSPGYTRLQPVSVNGNNRVLKKYLVNVDNETFVSNSFSLFPENNYLLDINGKRIHKQNKSGPSAPYGNTSIKYDFVFGFGCECPDLIALWAHRPRKYDWPDSNIIRSVSSLEAHVVPVANKGSNCPDTEWRICFTKAEMLLMHSLNEIQFMTYILLKLIAKSVLKPCCKEMSSYIMKNIVLWVVETHPIEAFSKETIVDRVVDSLIFLKECLRSNTLKSYMISERNLFEDRISPQERYLLLSKIEKLLDDREGMFKQCKKLCVAMTGVKESPKELLAESEKRDKIEKLVYKKNIVFKETDCPGIAVEKFQDQLKLNKFYRQYEEELHALVIPDNKDILNDFEDVFADRLSSILS